MSWEMKLCVVEWIPSSVKEIYTVFRWSIDAHHNEAASNIGNWHGEDINDNDDTCVIIEHWKCLAGVLRTCMCVCVYVCMLLYIIYFLHENYRIMLGNDKNKWLITPIRTFTKKKYLFSSVHAGFSTQRYFHSSLIYLSASVCTKIHRCLLLAYCQQPCVYVFIYRTDLYLSESVWLSVARIYRSIPLTVPSKIRLR